MVPNGDEGEFHEKEHAARSSGALVFGPVAVRQLFDNIGKRIHRIRNAMTDLKYRYF